MFLNFPVDFPSLYLREGLSEIDSLFLKELQIQDNFLYEQLLEARDRKNGDSALIISLAPYLEKFIAHLFDIENQLEISQKSHHDLSNLYACKKLFIQRRVLKTHSRDQIEDAFADLYPFINELDFANQVMSWLNDENNHQDQLDKASKYAAWAFYNNKNDDSILFKMPEKTDYEHLVEIDSYEQDNIKILKSKKHRPRDGFSFTDQVPSLEKALDQANYCIFCHNQHKDSCSKGLKEKDDSFKKNPLEVDLIGCPLEEKISEMNYLKSKGYVIGSLATAMIDNPLLAATGDRICNECIRSCIYQKQQGVDIPKIESRVLNDALELTWGFEIYSLLTRWNPLNFDRPLPKEDTNAKILVAGLGPAGFNLSHHLLNDGHMVVGIDGLKIEPLPSDTSGIDDDGNLMEFKPIKLVKDLFEDLDKRVAYGFGGVAEYGITVRWNKNYLKIIRLLLERRASFRMYGGVRFGGAITYDIAKKLGFDHVSLALGAGKPNLPEIKNIMCKGVRTASDFLMSLQLGGAPRAQSLANLQIRLPVVVIGGGLTAIDTATEALAYYPKQLEKFWSQYQLLVEKFTEEKVRENWSKEDNLIADEFLAHAHALMNKNPQEKISLIKSWGGVKILYRKSLEESPAYRLNHEEIILAMEEQIEFIPNITPEEIIKDEFESAKAIICDKGLIAAKTILLAAGTSPNTILADEDTEHFKLDGKYFQIKDIDGKDVSPIRSAKPGQSHILIDEFTSCVGDLHPSYAGSVVKAMASAKASYPIITNLLHIKNIQKIDGFLKTINDSLVARIDKVIRLTDNIVEIIVHAPLATASFHPGQFYRLQNFELNNSKAMEGLALTGAHADKEKGLLSLITMEIGASSKLCKSLKPGEKVVLMGPTGAPTEIKGDENILLIGGGLGNAVLFSIGKAFRDMGSKVLYVAGYRKKSDRYKIKEIEDAADHIIWTCEEEELELTREQDFSFKGNIIEAIKSYNKSHQPIKLTDINRIIAIGSDGMMNAVQEARKSCLKGILNDTHQAIASVNSPMQCMMKEICGQCIQKHIDPKTGLESFIYSCKEQDQNMDLVDFKNLKDRLAQNSLAEKLSDLFCVSSG